MSGGVGTWDQAKAAASNPLKQSSLTSSKLAGVAFPLSPPGF